MRVVIEWNHDNDGNELVSVDDNSTVQPIQTSQTTSRWLFPLLTCGIAIAIVVPSLSNSIKAMPPIAWLQSQVASVKNPQFPISTNTTAIASRLYAAMQRKGYPIAKADGKTNIIYLRGGDASGRKSGNRVNEWSDTRFVLMFRDGQPYIAGAWKATIKPGLPAIKNPLGKSGAAFIEDGYYHAWRLGTHRGIFGRTERGLVQVASVKFRRDVNHNGNVTGELLQTGMIGLNQHSGNNSKNVDRTSYACLVGQSSDGHLNQFIPLLENDPRYKADPQHIFGTAILSFSDL